MSADPGMLAYIGIKLPDLVAGFAGGCVNALIFKRSEPWSVVVSMTVGALTANYLGEPAARLLSLSEGTAAFIVGVTAMAVIQGIVAAAQNWRPVIPGGSSSPPANKPGS